MAKLKGAQKENTSVLALVPRSQRARITFKFQLDMARDNVEFFTQLQRWLVAKRSWKRYAMDGLRLIYDLKCGSTAVLLELFPNIREMLAVEKGSGGDLKNEIAELKRLILEQQAHGIPPSQTGYTMTSTQQAAQPVKFSGVSLALPSFDDDDDLPTVMIAKNKDTNAAKNFVAAMMKLY